MFDEIGYLGKSRNVDSVLRKYEKVLRDGLQKIKFHNPQSLMRISDPDLMELAQNLKNEYSIELVTRAMQETLQVHGNKDLTFGVFLEKCAALARVEKDYQQTKNEIDALRHRSRGNENYNHKSLKNQIKSVIKKPNMIEQNRRKEANRSKEEVLIRDLMFYGVSVLDAQRLARSYDPAFLNKKMVEYSNMGVMLAKDGHLEYPYSLTVFIDNNIAA